MNMKTKSYYDRREAVDERVRLAAPRLYWALKNLLAAVEERPDSCGIESVTLAEAHAAIASATLPPTTS